MPDINNFRIFVQGEDIMFVMLVHPYELDAGVIRAFTEEVESLGLQDIIFPDFMNIIKNAEKGIPEKIGQGKLKDEILEQLRSDELPFRIRIDGSGMKAFLDIIDSSVECINKEDVIEEIKTSEIKYGIINENIDQVLSEWPKITSLVVAMGSNPKRGNHAELEFVKEIKNDLSPFQMEDGFVDYKNLHLISLVKKGDVIQVRTPPTDGIPGRDVFGKTIPATPGTDKKLQVGNNTETVNNDTKLIASVGGYIQIGTDGKINVHEVYTVNGDVNYATGSFDYPSDVLIKGDVLAGFTVKSGGDVHIRGLVEDAVIEAKGNITIQGGVLSRGGAQLWADGDITASFIEHATVEASGSVFIKIEAVGSTITAGRDIQVIRSNGRIVGGSLKVGGAVITATIGSDNAPLLNVEFLGEPISKPVKERSFDNCLISARSVESAMEVQCGKLVKKVSKRKSPVTVIANGKRITVENAFIDYEKVNKRRKASKGSKNGKKKQKLKLTSNR